MVWMKAGETGMRYLLFSDFYDYVKITHLYHKV